MKERRSQGCHIYSVKMPEENLVTVEEYLIARVQETFPGNGIICHTWDEAWVEAEKLINETDETLMYGVKVEDYGTEGILTFAASTSQSLLEERGYEVSDDWCNCLNYHGRRLQWRYMEEHDSPFYVKA